jgi:hypothetical protein
MTSVQINNDRYGYSCFRRCNGNDEDGKENTVQLLREQVFVEGHKIDIHTIQHQFNGHEHGDHIPSGEQAIHANEEQGCTYEKNM